jgi:hypothetical protein
MSGKEKLSKVTVAFCRFRFNLLLFRAGIAQLVEQLICNQQVVGSNPTAGSLTNVVSSMR